MSARSNLKQPTHFPVILRRSILPRNILILRQTMLRSDSRRSHSSCVLLDEICSRGTTPFIRRDVLYNWNTPNGILAPGFAALSTRCHGATCTGAIVMGSCAQPGWPIAIHQDDSLSDMLGPALLKRPSATGARRLSALPSRSLVYSGDVSQSDAWRPRDFSAPTAQPHFLRGEISCRRARVVLSLGFDPTPNYAQS